MGTNRKDSEINPGGGKSPWDFVSLGMEFCIILVMGVYGGYWLDKKLESSPWLLLVSMVLSLSFGIYYIIQRTKDVA